MRTKRLRDWPAVLDIIEFALRKGAARHDTRPRHVVAKVKRGRQEFDPRAAQHVGHGSQESVRMSRRESFDHLLQIIARAAVVHLLLFDLSGHDRLCDPGSLPVLQQPEEGREVAPLQPNDGSGRLFDRRIGNSPNGCRTNLSPGGGGLAGHDQRHLGRAGNESEQAT